MGASASSEATNCSIRVGTLDLRRGIGDRGETSIGGRGTKISNLVPLRREAHRRSRDLHVEDGPALNNRFDIRNHGESLGNPGSERGFSYQREPASSSPRLVKNKEFPWWFACARMGGRINRFPYRSRKPTTLRPKHIKRIKSL